MHLLYPARCRHANNLDISSDGTIYFSDSHKLPVYLKQLPGERPYFDPFKSLMAGLYMVGLHYLRRVPR